MNPAVDAYIAALEPHRCERLTALRALIHDVAPDVSERIELRILVFTHCHRWVAIASQKSYISIYLRCQPGAAAVIASNPKLSGGKGCVNITDRGDLPLAALGSAIKTTLSG